MVEINNQRKAFLDMLAWSEGTDNGRFETRNHGYDVIVGGELFTDWFDHLPQTCHAKPKNSINRRRTLPASFPLVGCLPQAVYLKDFSGVGTLWHCSRLSERGALPMIDRVISAAIPRSKYLGFHCRALVMVVGYAAADSLIAKFKEAGGTVREIDVWVKSHRDYLRSGYLHHRSLGPSWAVNYYRDNAITYKAQRDKNARELKLANAAINTMQMRQRDVAAPDAKYTWRMGWC